jgi:N-acetylglucosamine kinase-like BadF-type ATPase
LARLYLGVDGGQSSTTALIGDESGRVLGMGRGGPCNHVKGPGGREKFLNAVGACVSAALVQAGFDPSLRQFRAAAMGFSGGPDDKTALIGELFEIGALEVTTDAAIALTGATAGEPGIIVIAGTGSIAYGRNAQRRAARAGGWGYLFGDEGGGFDLARQALRAILRHEEGWGPPTSLREKFLAAAGAASANALLHAFYTTDYPRPRIAAYSKFVDEAAREGDPIATEILKQAARQLATLAAAVRRQLFPDAETVPIAPIGGVFKSGLLREHFHSCAELEDGNRVQAPVHGPAAGALLEAYRLAGLPVKLINAPAEKESE